MRYYFAFSMSTSCYLSWTVSESRLALQQQLFLTEPLSMDASRQA